MAAITKLLSAFLLLALIGQGNCQCSLDQVTITQTKIAVGDEGKPVWKVTISNGSPCSQSNLELSCKGFQTVQPVDPSLLSKSGDLCLVNNGKPIGPSSSFTFTYAWTTSFPFHPVSSQTNHS